MLQLRLKLASRRRPLVAQPTLRSLFALRALGQLPQRRILDLDLLLPRERLGRELCGQHGARLRIVRVTLPQLLARGTQLGLGVQHAHTRRTRTRCARVNLGGWQ